MNEHPDPSGKNNVTESISTEEWMYQLVAKIPSRTQSQFWMYMYIPWLKLEGVGGSSEQTTLAQIRPYMYCTLTKWVGSKPFFWKPLTTYYHQRGGDCRMFVDTYSILDLGRNIRQKRNMGNGEAFTKRSRLQKQGLLLSKPILLTLVLKRRRDTAAWSAIHPWYNMSKPVRLEVYWIFSYSQLEECNNLTVSK